MRKERILLILGIWVALLPYLGFPYFLKNFLYTISGIVVAYFSYVLYKESQRKNAQEKTFDNFKEEVIQETVILTDENI